MTSSNLSIVDSLIRSHFGSVLWTRSSDITFFNDDRITQINMCFKDLPVKSKLYILMALGNLDSRDFLRWKDEVESLFLRAMVEGNLLVRAIATILQHKFSMNYLTFDISLSLENFSDTVEGLRFKMEEWDVGNDIKMEYYVCPNVVKYVRQRRKIESAKDDSKKKVIVGCNFRKTPRSISAKLEFLKKLQLECNKKRISVPIPGRSKLNTTNDEIESQNKRDSLMRSLRQSEQERKDLEIDAKLEEWRRKQQKRNNDGHNFQKKESKVLFLALDEMPISGPKAKQIQKEKDREQRKAEKEERARRAKEEKEMEKLRKQQEKENKRLIASEQRRLFKEEQDRQKQQLQQEQQEKFGETVGGTSGDAVTITSAMGGGSGSDEEDLAVISAAAENNDMDVTSSQSRVRMVTQTPNFPGSLSLGSTGTPIRIISHQTQQQFQQTQPRVVFLQARAPNTFSTSNAGYTPAPGTGPIRIVRLVNSSNSGTNNSSINQNLPITSLPTGARIVRLVSTQPQINSGTHIVQQQQPTPRIINHQQIQQPQPIVVASGSQQFQTQGPPPQQHSTVGTQEYEYIEEMKMLIRYANRLTRPQKAMILSFITRTADGVDFRGISEIHLSSHRGVNYDTSTNPPQSYPLNMIVDAYFIMDFQTGRWSVNKRYRSPMGDEELCRLDLQPQGYPPELGSN